MIDRGHALPVSKLCAALGISRGSIHYEPVAVSASDLALMHRQGHHSLESSNNLVVQGSLRPDQRCRLDQTPRSARRAVGAPSLTISSIGALPTATTSAAIRRARDFHSPRESLRTPATTTIPRALTAGARAEDVVDGTAAARRQIEARAQ